MYNQGLLGWVLGGGPTHPTELWGGSLDHANSGLASAAAKVPPWKPKVREIASAGYPNVAPKSLRYLWVDPSKHMVFTLWEPHWATSEGVGSSALFLCVSWRLLF